MAFLGGAGFIAHKLYLNLQPEELVEVQLETPSLPTVSFSISGRNVNELLAYKREMDVSAAREYLTPLDAQGKLNIVINDYGNDIQSASYAVMTLDGKTTLFTDEISVEEYETSLALGIVTTDVVESVLHIKLLVGDEEIHYYTRIIGYDQLMLEENLSFIEEIHKATMDTEQWEYLDDILDSVVDAGDPDLSNVNLKSSMDEIQWAGLDTKIIGEVKWRITETSSVYTGIELSYVLQVKTEVGSEYFRVEEYFRTSYSSSKEEVLLNDYQRTASQFYKPNAENVEYKKIKVAVNGDVLDVVESEDENIIAFVQAKELFSYNSKENIFTKIYGDNTWLGYEELDSRYLINQYDVRALDVDEDGNISFIVFGYVNGGENEGLVGTSIYYYDALEGVTLEKAFICGDKSFAQSKEELAQNAYYNTENQEIYIMVNQIIYAINLESMDKRQISQRLHQGEYVFSEEKDYIAFNNGEGDILSSLTVLSIESGEEYNIHAKDGENIYPFGFVGADLVVGYGSKEATKDNYRGQEITPAYQVEVRDESNKVIKTYSKDNYFIEDISVEDRVLYLNQVTLKDGIYNMAESEYIANNISVKESGIAISDGTDEHLGRVKYITLRNTTSVDWISTQATNMKNENKIIIVYESNGDEQMYHVYAYGKLYKSCKDFAEAIALADTHYGYVLNNNQGYSWRRGARALNYTSISSESQIKSKLKGGMTAMELVQSYAPDSLQNYTGLSLENMCYLINQDQVIAMKFNTGSWGVLTGYSIDTIYYLDESGVKRSGDINRLSSQVETLIGNSNLY